MAYFLASPVTHSAHPPCLSIHHLTLSVRHAHVSRLFFRNAAELFCAYKRELRGFEYRKHPVLHPRRRDFSVLKRFVSPKKHVFKNWHLCGTDSIPC